MFSSRFHWDVQRNRLTELLADKRGQGARILDLTQSNPTRAGIEYPEELRRVFDHPGVLRYDPLPAGSLEAREAVADYYRQRGHAVEPGRILLTASTSEGYSYLFKLLADPGDEVLVPRPSYPLFEYLARMESIEVCQYPPRIRWRMGDRHGRACPGHHRAHTRRGAGESRTIPPAATSNAGNWKR